MSNTEHKTCNLIPAYATSTGVQIACSMCTRSVFYTDDEVKQLTPWTIEEVKFRLHHKHWIWDRDCDIKGCHYCG